MTKNDGLDKTSLARTHPHLAKEWHKTKNKGVSPQTVSAFTHQKAWWRCSKNHEWEAVVAQRAGGSGCPFCAGNRTLAGFNDLKSLRPDVAATWSPRNTDVEPDEVGPNSHRKVWWVEPCGHEFEMAVAARTRRKLSCKICSGKERVVGVNDLATTHPSLSLEWDFNRNGELDPSKVQKGSSKSVWWIGEKCRHSWEARVSTRTRKNASGCPVCLNQKVQIGENDLATTHPEIAAEFDRSKSNKLEPNQVVAGSEKKLWWMCPLGHSYEASPYSRTVSKTGCPICKNKKVLKGHNDFLSQHPQLAKEWDYEKNKKSPDEYSLGSHSKAWFLCPLSHSYKTEIRTRSRGNDCPYCGRKALLKGFNDLATEFPNIAKEWDYQLNERTPDSVSSGSISKAWFKCDLGHSYETLIQSKTRGQTGCPFCGNFKVLKGFNDLATKSPEIASEWSKGRNGSKQPSDYVYGSHSYAWFTCFRGHEWRSTIVGRQKSGCPSCAEFGFKPHRPAVFYFIENPGLAARKVGITNMEQRSVRLSGFKANGWIQLLILESEKGENIVSLEREVLKWIRGELALPVKLTSRQIGRQGGWTETFPIDGVSNDVILKRIKLEARKLGIK